MVRYFRLDYITLLLRSKLRETSVKELKTTQSESI